MGGGDRDGEQKMDLSYLEGRCIGLGDWMWVSQRVAWGLTRVSSFEFLGWMVVPSV